MKHFATEEWVDFSRGALHAERKARMKRHLEAGCSRCRKALELWQRVEKTAKRIESLEPPEAVVRSIKGCFAIHGPRKKRRWSGEVAKLIFDSLQNPLPAGIRATAAGGRQMLYSAGSIQVDLNVTLQPGSEKVLIEGQVLNAAKPHEFLNGVTVLLFRGHDAVAGTLTNSFGEFHLEWDADEEMHLWVNVPEQKEFYLPMGELACTQTGEDRGIRGAGASRKKRESTRKRVLRE